jgi:hypothetical protein
MAKQSLDLKIEKQQKEAWELAELIDNEQLKNKEKIFERGLIEEETDFLKNPESEEAKNNYLALLLEMKSFYKKIARQQQVI